MPPITPPGFSIAPRFGHRTKAPAAPKPETASQWPLANGQRDSSRFIAGWTSAIRADALAQQSGHGKLQFIPMPLGPKIGDKTQRVQYVLRDGKLYRLEIDTRPDPKVAGRENLLRFRLEDTTAKTIGAIQWVSFYDHHVERNGHPRRTFRHLQLRTGIVESPGKTHQIIHTVPLGYTKLPLEQLAKAFLTHPLTRKQC